ncbi:arylamine N-acetyltransferase [Streptomyces triculaminicus]|uniref:Arylamine N-acetyltransferase n=2 Tax=Streptomyces TaxID=1883 RepID=A0A939FP75_9ACTN|nr:MULTISPECIES: arylamine N-acetyltransferase [Streptomyces]MBO0654334.1 arylamine N-acetyltransferase [Streptomyces triculaminicus]QSY48970.1 arylamine N-acetyltransferase [Streptomyces griseocarneus]
MHTGRTHDWNGDLLDLDAYLDRIGYRGERAPTLEVLRALHRAHVTSIPFENINAVLDIPILLDIPSVQDKLVRGRRGGYCFEHVVLFAAVLQRLGFEFTAMNGRVTLGEEKILPATHALLAVTAADDERLWLCDVGFGCGPLEPVELADGAEADFDGWRFRLERREGPFGIDDWWLYQYGADGWRHRHTFTLNPQYTIDFVVGSHFVATHPRSPFSARLFAQRFSATHHHRLDMTTWTTFGPDGSSTERKIGPAELGRVLEEDFGIVVSAEDLARIGEGLVSPS